jgi:hypothetical protein
MQEIGVSIRLRKKLCVSLELDYYNFSEICVVPPYQGHPWDWQLPSLIERCPDTEVKNVRLLLKLEIITTYCIVFDGLGL